MEGGFAGEFCYRFSSCFFAQFDSIAPAFSPFGPTIGCSTSCPPSHSVVVQWVVLAVIGGPRRTSAFPGEGKSRPSQTATTGGTCRFVRCLLRFFSLTKRDLPLVNSHAKNFRIFWDRDCLQLPWRAQPASFSRSSGGARGGFYYITAWVSARRSHAPGRCTGY